MPELFIPRMIVCNVSGSQYRHEHSMCHTIQKLNQSTAAFTHITSWFTAEGHELQNLESRFCVSGTLLQDSSVLSP